MLSEETYMHMIWFACWGYVCFGLGAAGYFDDLFDRRKEPEPEPRIWDVEELRKLPVGTKIRHPSLGKGVIEKVGWESVVSFAGDYWYFGTNASHPWDKPILVFLPEQI